MAKKENMQPLSLREGNVFIDGVKVMEACKLNIKYTPDVWSGRCLGDRGTNRRWIGRDITGSLTEYRTTNWYMRKIREYEKNGTTPEFTIQGVRNDKNSDFGSSVGEEKITLKGCVFTGDVNLMDLDVDGDVVKDEIAFGAKTLV